MPSVNTWSRKYKQCRSSTIVENDDIQHTSKEYNNMCISDQRDISLLRHKRAKWIYILRLIKVDERYEPKNWISWNVLCNLK